MKFTAPAQQFTNPLTSVNTLFAFLKGSHGARPKNPDDWPVFISNRPELLQAPQMEATDVYHALMRHVLK